jgi:hypothetical protein
MALSEKLKNLTVKNLKPAKYNPRTITGARLEKLNQSLNTFGDLSGIVYNIKTGLLVSGHQRIKTLGNIKTKIVQSPFTDAFGTVSIGHVEAKTENGVIKIPFRAVNWSSTREKAANIAANAHGGNFDKEKLALVLADLENVKEFALDIVGLDPLTIKSLKIGTDDMPPTKEFKEFGSDLKTEHECPKCNYKW